MENPRENLLTKQAAIPSQLPPIINSLTATLASLAPTNSETTQIITYTLLAAAVVGITVYHYIKTQELEI